MTLSKVNVSYPSKHMLLRTVSKDQHVVRHSHYPHHQQGIASFPPSSLSELKTQFEMEVTQCTLRIHFHHQIHSLRADEGIVGRSPLKHYRKNKVEIHKLFLLVRDDLRLSNRVDSE